MKAAAYMGKKDIRIVDVSDPEVKKDGVLIKIKACGICGSDLHVYKADMLVEASTRIIDDYRIIGHEYVGEIVEVGNDVKDFKVGDRVVSVHNKGGMAEYSEISGEKLQNLYKLPENVDFITAATLEPFCNPTHSYHLHEPKDGDTVAIFGAGIMGLGYLQLVKAYNDARTIIVDVAEKRLDTARRIGVDFAINAREEDPVRKIKEITGEYEVRYQEKTAGGCDITVEYAGLPLTLGQCFELAKPEYGTVVIGSVFEGTYELDPNMIMFKYMQVWGSMGYYPRETEEALDLMVSGKVDRSLLITHTMPLEEAAEGFATQATPGEAVKVILTMD